MPPGTPLQRQLAGTDDRRPQPLDALELGRRTLWEGRRLDMQALAAELGVSRVTLYRWVGDREQFLVEVLWSMTQRWFDRIWVELDAVDGPRLPEALHRWIADTVSEPGLRSFLYGESELAMRLLTLDSGGFQPRMVALLTDLIDREVDDGRLAPTLPSAELAYAVLRIVESYIYLPVITGQDTDPDLAYRVLTLLLPAPAAASRTDRPQRGRRR